MTTNPIDALRHYQIDFAEPPHPNVTRGWLGVPCPFCGDSAYHGGLHRESGAFSCWKCSETTNLAGYISRMTGLPYDAVYEGIGSIRAIPHANARQRLRERLGASGGVLEAQDEPPKPALPPLFLPVRDARNKELLKRFLDTRRYSLTDADGWGCGVCEAGRYMHRLVLPVTAGDGLAGWQARDMTGKAKEKYRFPKGFKAAYHLYGLDRIADKAEEVVLVEGVFDVWRAAQAGVQVVGTFGAHLNPPQVSLLYSRGVRRLVFLWDADATGKARAEASGLRGLFESTVIRMPPGKDPDECEVDELRSLLREDG